MKVLGECGGPRRCWVADVQDGGRDEDEASEALSKVEQKRTRLVDPQKQLIQGSLSFFSSRSSLAKFSQLNFSKKFPAECHFFAFLTHVMKVREADFRVCLSQRDLTTSTRKA